MIENGDARTALNCSAAELGESVQIRSVQTLIVNARLLAGRDWQGGFGTRKRSNSRAESVHENPIP